MTAEQPADEPRWRRAGEPIQFMRAELLDLVRDRGVALTDRQFRTWAEMGLLPRPQRRIPPLTTDGVARALYPRWTPILIFDLDDQIRKGAKIGELKDHAAERMRAYRAGATIEVPEDRPPDAIWPRVPRALQRAAWDYVARFEAAFPGGDGDGNMVQDVVLTLRLGTGYAIEVPILAPPSTAASPRDGLPGD